MTNLYFQTFWCILSPWIIWIFITGHCFCWSDISASCFYSRWYLDAPDIPDFFFLLLHNFKLEFRFCAGSNPACGMRWLESLTMVPAGNKALRPSSVNHSAKAIQFISLCVAYRGDFCKHFCKAECSITKVDPRYWN